MLGTSLVVVAVLSQLATAGLAIWRTLREPPCRLRLALLFLALAIAGTCATIWTAVRRHEAVAVPAAIVDKSPPPRVPRASLRVTTREVTTMGANQLVRVTIGFENEGDRAATDVQRVQMVNFILSPYGEEEAFRILRAELRSVGGESLSLAPAERLSFTIEGPRLVAGDFLPRGADDQQVARDSRPLLVAGIIRYRADDAAEATVEYCFYAMNPNVLVECSASGNPRPAAPRS